MRRNLILSAILGIAFAAIGFSCSRSSSDDGAVASKKLYIATGICYSGTGFTAPSIGDVGQLVSRLDIDSRQYQVIHDYANLANEPTESYANGITDGGDGYIYVAVENATSTGNRKIDKILKTTFGDRTVWQPNNAVLAGGGILKGISRMSDKGVIFGTTASVERYDATPTRVTTGTALAPTSWGAALANDGVNRDCSANNTNITDIVALPSAVTGDAVGKYIYAHSAVGQMDVGVVSKQGGNSAGTCLANAPGGATLTKSATAIAAYDNTLSAAAAPTSIVYVPTGSGTGKLLVAYSSSTFNGPGATSLNNALVMYDFAENTAAGETATLSNGTILYNDNDFLGVSAIAYDPSSRYLYAARVDVNGVSAGVPHGYIIERYLIDLTTPGATRVLDSNNSSFEEANSFTNCPTSMLVGD
jgi:hypothetical protein